MTFYRYTGSHPQDFEVGDKVLMIGTGEGIELDDEQLKNYQELVDAGSLIKGTKSEAESTPPATGGKK